jgi:cell division protein FtsB
LEAYLIPIVALLVSVCTIILSVSFGNRKVDINYVQQLRSRIVALQATLKAVRLSELKLKNELDELKQKNLDLLQKIAEHKKGGS